jgi:twitching motility protein PilT
MGNNHYKISDFKLKGKLMLNIINDVLEIVSNKRVSDVHLTVGEPIWFRASGHMQRYSEDMLSGSDITILLREMGINDDPEHLAEPKESGKDGDGFAVELGNHRFRADIVFANGRQIAMVLRTLNSEIPTVETLGLPEALIKQTLRPTGIVIVTGATGSGKSTTLASLLNNINMKQTGHIITIEDPVEYPLKSIQCKVTTREIGMNRDASSFSAALRNAMREDPDIIMIGEIRDAETMRAAFSAAETGHLVFATLHTNSAIKTIDRVLSFFPADEKDWARNVFASVLNCVMSQTLVPRADGGRALGYELMLNLPEVASVIREDKLQTMRNVIGQSGNSGQMLMNNCLLELVKNRTITAEAALAATYDPNELRGALSHG